MTTTLLAVDDSVTMRKVMEITFSGETYKTVVASSAAEAMKAAASERPAMVLIDHTLPDMSGYDLARELKAKVPNLAVIILSSKQSPYDKARGGASGVDDFMDKPFDTQKLLDKVAQVLSQPRAAAAAAPAPAPAPPAPIHRPATPQAPAVSPIARPAPMATAPSVAHRAPGPAASVGARPATPGGTPAGPPVAPMPPASAMQPRSPNAPTLATPKPSIAQKAAVPAAPQAPAPSIAAAVAAAGGAGNGQLAGKLEALGLTKAQVDGVLALSQEVVEKVVWEVVPVLAETLIKEEIRRLTSG